MGKIIGIVIIGIIVCIFAWWAVFAVVIYKVTGWLTGLIMSICKNKKNKKGGK